MALKDNLPSLMEEADIDSFSLAVSMRRGGYEIKERPVINWMQGLSNPATIDHLRLLAAILGEALGREITIDDLVRTPTEAAP